MSFRVVARMMRQNVCEFSKSVTFTESRTVAPVTFATESEAVAWMDGAEGDMFADIVSMESEEVGAFVDDIFVEEIPEYGYYVTPCGNRSLMPEGFTLWSGTNLEERMLGHSSVV